MNPSECAVTLLCSFFAKRSHGQSSAISFQPINLLYFPTQMNPLSQKPFGSKGLVTEKIVDAVEDATVKKPAITYRESLFLNFKKYT
jgi:hypothetical protein